MKRAVFAILIIGALTSSCASMQHARRNRDVDAAFGKLKPGETTLQQTLDMLGKPDNFEVRDTRMVTLYETRPNPFLLLFDHDVLINASFDEVAGRQIAEAEANQPSTAGAIFSGLMQIRQQNQLNRIERNTFQPMDVRTGQGIYR